MSGPHQTPTGENVNLSHGGTRHFKKARVDNIGLPIVVVSPLQYAAASSPSDPVSSQDHHD